jgi:uncharacterized protein
MEELFPGLIAEVRRRIEDSERKFAPGCGGKDSYLWEHTTHVASLAFDLAKSEKMDPVLPAVAALFHDAGKFKDGTYHKDVRPEEEDAARLAESVLRGTRMRAADIRTVASAIRALYNARSYGNRTADIVHDADFLAKFGALGVAQFFIKSTLRGQTLRSALLGSLSKELTYAAVLPRNMRTKAGERRAEKKSAETLRYFRSLVRELRETRIEDIEMKRVRVKPVSRPGRAVDVLLAVPRICEACGGNWRIAHRTVRGVKCEKLEAEIICVKCGEKSSFSFCLPEIAK